MDEKEKEHIKEQIKDIIDSVDNEDMLVYLYTYIDLKVKAEE